MQTPLYYFYAVCLRKYSWRNLVVTTYVQLLYTILFIFCGQPVNCVALHPPKQRRIFDPNRFPELAKINAPISTIWHGMCSQGTSDSYLYSVCQYMWRTLSYFCTYAILPWHFHGKLWRGLWGLWKIVLSPNSFSLLQRTVWDRQFIDLVSCLERINRDFFHRIAYIEFNVRHLRTLLPY